MFSVLTIAFVVVASDSFSFIVVIVVVVKARSRWALNTFSSQLISHILKPLSANKPGRCWFLFSWLKPYNFNLKIDMHKNIHGSSGRSECDSKKKTPTTTKKNWIETKKKKKLPTTALTHLEFCVFVVVWFAKYVTIYDFSLFLVLGFCSSNVRLSQYTLLE